MSSNGVTQMPRDYKDEKQDSAEFVILRRVSCTLISCVIFPVTDFVRCADIRLVRIIELKNAEEIG
jgi:hypothetical protein